MREANVLIRRSVRDSSHLDIVLQLWRFLLASSQFEVTPTSIKDRRSVQMVVEKGYYVSFIA